MTDPVVLVTGAGGALGQVLLADLPALGWVVRGLDVRASPGVDVGSVRDEGRMREAMRGVDAVVHLGGVSLPGAPWRDYLETNIDGTRTVLEVARRLGVRRVVLGSSNHAAGFVRRGPGELPADVPVRPDSTYGVSKAAIEALGSLYADAYGLEVTSLRIGSCFPRPSDRRALATWLSYADFVRLVQAALVGPWHGHTTVWGVSRNTRRWWSLEAGVRIGYEPVDDAEVYADVVAETDSEWLGGDAPMRSALRREDLEATDLGALHARGITALDR